MTTPSIAAERTSQTRAIERLEELLPLVTRYTAALTAESFGPALDEAQAAWNADSGIHRDFAALEIRDCIDRFRANMAGIPARKVSPRRTTSRSRSRCSPTEPRASATTKSRSVQLSWRE